MNLPMKNVLKKVSMSVLPWGAGEEYLLPREMEVDAVDYLNCMEASVQTPPVYFDKNIGTSVQSLESPADLLNGEEYVLFPQLQSPPISTSKDDDMSNQFFKDFVNANALLPVSKDNDDTMSIQFFEDFVNVDTLLNMGDEMPDFSDLCCDNDEEITKEPMEMLLAKEVESVVVDSCLDYGSAESSPEMSQETIDILLSGLTGELDTAFLDELDENISLSDIIVDNIVDEQVINTSISDKNVFDHIVDVQVINTSISDKNVADSIVDEQVNDVAVGISLEALDEFNQLLNSVNNNNSINIDTTGTNSIITSEECLDSSIITESDSAGSYILIDSDGNVNNISINSLLNSHNFTKNQDITSPDSVKSLKRNYSSATYEQSPTPSVSSSSYEPPLKKDAYDILSPTSSVNSDVFDWDLPTIRRHKNNEASKVTRAKRKTKHKDLFEKENELLKSNAELRIKVEVMQKEADILRDLLVAALSKNKN